MDGLGSSFLQQKSLCMVMASNKSSNKRVMRERVLVIVFLNDVSLEVAISTLTASQNINCPYLVGVWQIVRSSIQFKPSWKDSMIVNNCRKRWKEVASKSNLCDSPPHWIESCSSDITLHWVHVIEFLQLNRQEQHSGHIWYTFMCMWKDLQEKGESHLVLSPF